MLNLRIVLAAAALVLFAGAVHAQALIKQQRYEMAKDSSGADYRDPTSREALDSGSW